MLFLLLLPSLLLLLLMLVLFCLLSRNRYHVFKNTDQTWIN